MLDTDTVLGAIGSTECSSFGDLCEGLGAERPEKGDRAAWRELFQILDQAERDGLVEIERLGGRLESVILTAAGADLIRAKKDQSRGLLTLL